MPQSINPATKQPYRILWFGDLVHPSGFGRIGNEICKRLVQRGYALQGVSIPYSGWPHGLPFHVWPLVGQDMWQTLTNIINGTIPPIDLLISCQDFPYHQTIWNACKLDFSRLKWVWITPVDGTPIHPDWLKMCDVADGKMVISRFGVEALRQEGKRVDLCHPGVDVGEFYPAEADERAELRKAAGYGVDDYIVGSMCMNQGRKAIPAMIEGFHEFAKDKPEAKLYLDMDATSPAGWDIPNLLIQMGWTEEERKRVKCRPELMVKDGKTNEAMLSLRNRYCLLDLHMVISHREGFGLPLLESMACRIPTMAMDWCSGTEIVGTERGFLIPKIDYMEYGTWGGAKDAFPDMEDFVLQLNGVYTSPEIAAATAQRGYDWAIQQTWDKATDQVEATIQTALKRKRTEKPTNEPFIVPTPSGALNDDGKQVEPNPLPEQKRSDGSKSVHYTGDTLDGRPTPPEALIGGDGTPKGFIVYAENVGSIRGDSFLQRPPLPPEMREVPDADGPEVGRGGPVADTGAGRPQPRLRRKRNSKPADPVGAK